MGVIGLAVSGMPASPAEVPLLQQAIDACRRQLATTVEPCADLEWLLQRYRTPPSADSPDPQRLVAIERDLRAGPQEKPSAWQRLIQWLRQIQTPPEQQGPGWVAKLVSLLRRMPHWLEQWIVYASMAVILALAVVLIWREGRIVWADVRRARRRGRSTVAGARVTAAPLTLGDVDAAPARDRPVWLLRLLVQTLVAKGRISGERALTHGELITRAAFSNESQRQRFARIARLAEQRRYAADDMFDRERARDGIEAALVEGRQLYVQLAASTGMNLS
jgi:hypothetical protein